MFNCFKKSPPKMVRETPTPIDPEPRPTLGLIVGHTAKSPGATLATGGSEYWFNKQVANYTASIAPSMGLNVKVFYRDRVGISGAYQAALQADCDMLVELHFNAFNTKVTGTETLCTYDPEDKRLAGLMQAYLCQAFNREGTSRGVKPLPRSARGGRNIYSAPGTPNCLVEPFFGDNKREATYALDHTREYAEALIRAALKFTT